MKRYKRMTTAQLDALLQAELRKDTPNEEVVLPILEILEQREEKPRRKNRWIISAAAIAAALALVVTVLPKAAGADSFWDAVLHMTDSVLQFLAPGDTPDSTEADYVFETDNPGLQQLYDKVVELGVTDPIVPMWLPDGYELVKTDFLNLDGSIKLSFLFKSANNEIVIAYKIAKETSSTQYERLLEHVEVYEEGRVGHSITKNTGNWVINWVQNNVEGLITAGVNKEDIYRIIQSIYRRN